MRFSQPLDTSLEEDRKLKEVEKRTQKEFQLFNDNTDLNIIDKSYKVSLCTYPITISNIVR